MPNWWAVARFFRSRATPDNTLSKRFVCRLYNFNHRLFEFEAEVDKPGIGLKNKNSLKNILTFLTFAG